MITKTRLLGSLPAGHGEELLRLSREVSFPPGTQLFREGETADRFWVLRSGSVALEAHVPGRREQVLETLGNGELLGWSWMFKPYQWHLGARAVTRVHAYEFDAAAVRELCARDLLLGSAFTLFVARTIARRLQAARIRLLDLPGPPDQPGPRP
ncbi:cyclic nucleotide-binding domain-containing protein [Streptomyces iconiensis]|uniref:Cyclic nucleotide-binding domain-containing protein n=1 Tax=Streptomyces iconiensis TaxID=1384038 RepID=A0ABT7A2H3_9ACTN|nr:cyclic nucleotide-binding domain-containing protein [Streptomyces iconiensis]MDJ1135496.1 cyclic nucleotide-binding domain-containing protein [Streptomyces iconiensis]